MPQSRHEASSLNVEQDFGSVFTQGSARQYPQIERLPIHSGNPAMR
jgi:hypothetical protein